MTIRHLKIFIAVVETGKMNAAAKQLYITQPSVSQAVQELEAHYHTLLFQRHAKKLYITESGKILYSYAKPVVSQFDQLEENMLTQKHREKYHLGATVSVGGSILSPLVKRIYEVFPDIDVHTFVGNTKEIEEKLLNMELDAGIVEGIIKSPDLITIPLLKDPLVLACSKNHPLASKKTLHVEDLKNQNFAIREQGSGTRELLERFLSFFGIQIHVVLEAHTPDSIKNAVRFNQCLTLISARLLEPELKSNEFVAYSSQGSLWNRSFRLVYHKRNYKMPYLDSLKEIIHSCGNQTSMDELIYGRLIEQP